MPEAEKGRLKVLFILDGSHKTPSARVRALQYRDLLDSRSDVRAEFVTHRWPLLTSLQEFLQRIRAHGRLQSLAARFSSGMARYREASILRKAAGFDIVYVVKVPSVRLYEKLSGVKGPLVYMDLNDGLWLPFHRGAGWGELDAMLRLTAGIICENRFVLEYARKFNANSHIVHDPPQVEVFDAWRGKVVRDPDRVVIGWVGSPSSCDALYALFEPLETLFARHPNLHLRLVGVREDRIPRFEKVRFSLVRSYNQEEMVKEILAMDIGLFPMFKVEDALVRGTLKAMVYMSGGAVAAVTDVGEAKDLIQDGVNGILASTPDEWIGKLDRLIRDRGERERMGQAGLKTIREKFTKELCLEALLSAFRSGLALSPGGKTS